MKFNEIASLLSWKICQGFPIPLSGTLLSFMDAQRSGNGLFMVTLSLCKTGGQVGVLGTASLIEKDLFFLMACSDGRKMRTLFLNVAI